MGDRDDAQDGVDEVDETLNVEDTLETDGTDSTDDVEAADVDGADEGVDDDEAPDDGLSPVPDDVGAVLYFEKGSGWWPLAVGPILIAAVLIMEALGPGQVHWPVMLIFLVVIMVPAYLFITAARTYASVELTEKTLRCGTRRINLSDIAKIYPPNNSGQSKDWEKSLALGELPAVPRGRKGIGIKTVNGKLAQAWARDSERLRTELTEAHLAVQMGLA